MGLGLKALLPDDVVCVLFGEGIIPFVLRPIQGHYQLIGDAYVRGMIDDEATRQWKTGKMGILCSRYDEG